MRYYSQNILGQYFYLRFPFFQLTFFVDFKNIALFFMFYVVFSIGTDICELKYRLILPKFTPIPTA